MIAKFDETKSHTLKAIGTATYQFSMAFCPLVDEGICIIRFFTFDQYRGGASTRFEQHSIKEARSIYKATKEAWGV
jgi:hypothetical protein